MRERKSLLRLCVDRAGSNLKGARMAAFIVAWGLARDALGRVPSVEEYAEWWGQPRRTAFEEQAAFREVFAPLQTPDPLLDHMRRVGMGEKVDAAALGVGLPA